MAISDLDDMDDCFLIFHWSIIIKVGLFLNIHDFFWFLNFRNEQVCASRNIGDLIETTVALLKCERTLHLYGIF